MRAFAILALLMFSAPAWAADPLIDTIVRVKPSIVGIGSHDPLRRGQSDLLGTGFAVGDGHHVMTALHVVHSRNVTKESRAAKLVVFVGEGEDGEIRDASIVAEDKNHDIALLKIDGTAVPTLRLDLGPVRPDGANIAFTGFPIGAVYGLYPATHRGMIAASTPIARAQASPGDLTPDMIRALQNKLIVYQLDATSFPGNSGGPLYDPGTGIVIGIINSTFVQETKESALERPSGVTFAIPIGPAVDLLKSRNLTP